MSGMHTAVVLLLTAYVLLKLVFRGQPESVPHENSLMDSYRAMERMDQMSAQLRQVDGAIQAANWTTELIT